MLRASVYVNYVGRSTLLKSSPFTQPMYWLPSSHTSNQQYANPTQNAKVRGVQRGFQGRKTLQEALEYLGPMCVSNSVDRAVLARADCPAGIHETK